MGLICGLIYIKQTDILTRTIQTRFVWILRKSRPVSQSVVKHAVNEGSWHDRSKLWFFSLFEKVTVDKPDPGNSCVKRINFAEYFHFFHFCTLKVLCEYKRCKIIPVNRCGVRKVNSVMYLFQSKYYPRSTQ